LQKDQKPVVRAAKLVKGLKKKMGVLGGRLRGGLKKALKSKKIERIQKEVGREGTVLGRDSDKKKR